MQEASERLGQLTRPEDPAQAGTHTGGCLLYTSDAVDE